MERLLELINCGASADMYRALAKQTEDQNISLIAESLANGVEQTEMALAKARQLRDRITGIYYPKILPLIKEYASGSIHQFLESDIKRVAEIYAHSTVQNAINEIHRIEEMHNTASLESSLNREPLDYNKL